MTGAIGEVDIEDADTYPETVTGVRGTNTGEEGTFGVGQVKNTDGTDIPSEREDFTRVANAGVEGCSMLEISSELLTGGRSSVAAKSKYFGETQLSLERRGCLIA